MIGDNLSTDILFANNSGIDSLLVLSGVTSAEKAIQIMANKDKQTENNNLELEGVPTYVQSLFAQKDDIDFNFSNLLNLT
jgi:ribonucleotide monophosphatase NagD (HAD superfamily)